MKQVFGTKRLYIFYGVGLCSLLLTAIVGCKTGSLVSGGTGLPGNGEIVFNDPSVTPTNNNPPGATYVGITVCTSCHSRATSGHPNGIVAEYLQTPHGLNVNNASAVFWTRTIFDGHWPSSTGLNTCNRCHVTGAMSAGQAGIQDNGFDTTSGVAYDSPHNRALWSMQCEGCHGPGSLHVSHGGAPQYINRVPDSKKVCWNCHVHQPNEKGNVPTGPITDSELASSPFVFDPTTNNNSLRSSHAAGILAAGPAANLYEYPGKIYEHSPHYKIGNTCQTCHAYRPFNQPTLDHSSINPRKEVCANCHGGAANAVDLAHVVVNKEGQTLEETQAEITALLVQLGGATSTGAPDNNGYGAGGALRTYLANGGLTTDLKYRRARWNFTIIARDQSLGAHDFDYAKQILQDSIDDLTH